MNDLIAFLTARLDEDERIALAASSEYDRVADQPEHWRWECDTDDEPLDPDLAIAGGEEFLGHGDHGMIGLRSLETHPSTVPGMRPLVHLALQGCEEVAPQVARHIACHDPARVLREVAAKRAIVAECDLLLKVGIAYPDEAGPESAGVILRHLAAVYSDHPDYRPEWATGSSASSRS